MSLSATLLVAGCSLDLNLGRDPISLREGAETVKLEFHPPSKNCTELGPIVGLTNRLDRVRFTRLEIVERDQQNALRNAAYALGGDYVYFNPDDPKANSGTVYQCDSRPAKPRIVPRMAPRAVPRMEMPAPPPAAMQQSPAKPAPVEPPKSIKDRLRLLQSLYRDGLITAEEYAAKKKTILDEL